MSVDEAQVKEFVSYIVKNLVDYPDEIKVEVVEENSNKVVRITGNQGDYGKIIGKKGRIINSIRSLLVVLVRESDKRWVIDVPEKS